MARFYPEAPRGTEPVSELEVRSALQALDDDWRVFSSVAWQAIRGGRQGDGEADFVLLHRKHGVLVLEVKGGGVRVDGGRWLTTDRFGVTHGIKDPFRQALDSKHALLHFLNTLVPPLPTVPRVCHGVVFPNVTLLERIGTQPREILIDDADLLDARATVERVVRHWNQWDASELPGIQIDRITDVLAPTVKLRRRLRADVAAAEAALVQLTRQQVAVLRGLRSARRCIVRGGAGTGKTLLAMEKARQMARDGGRVLLTCFNAPLADQVAVECSDVAGITVSTFHALALSRARAARLTIPSDPSVEWWENEAPNLVANSLEIAPRAFDALVVDEAQDFCDGWITALLMLLAEPDTSPVYMFLDSHQQLYNRSLSVPAWFPFELDTNCRNTLPIARRVASVFGDPPPELGATGRNPAFVELPRSDDAPSLVQEVVDRLLLDEGLLPSQVVVLADDRALVDTLHELVLARSCFVPLGGKGVVAETVHRFKGLESEVVVLVLSASNPTNRDALLYVGMSRARSLLVVIGPKGVRNRFDLR